MNSIYLIRETPKRKETNENSWHTGKVTFQIKLNIKESKLTLRGQEIKFLGCIYNIG